MLNRCLTVAATCIFIAASALPSHGENGRNAALIGGLAAGALLGGAIASEMAPRERVPVVEEEVEMAPPPRCHIRQEPLYDRFGNVVETREIRVCR